MTLKIALLAGAAASIPLVVLMVRDSGEPIESVSRPRVVSTTTPCGQTEVDIVRAYKAVADHDFEGLKRMAERSNILTLTEDTPVHELAVTGKLSRVRATSGANIGERCWVATSMLR